jgi:aminoglycoside phosphotransferase (APT) family kinase protein
VFEFGSGAVAKVPLQSTPEGWIRFEAIYSDLVAGCGLPVPRVLGLEMIDGREVSIFERIDGPTMWDLLMSRPADAVEFGRELGELHRRVLVVTPPIALPSQRSRVLAKIAEGARSFDASIGGYASTVPEVVDPVVLCHGDFHPKNIIVSERGPYLIDWFDASRGDSCGDVARTSVLLGGQSTSPTEDVVVPVQELPHLPGASRVVLDALHDSYLETVTAVFAWTLNDLTRWREIQVAARLSEGID